MKANVFTLLIAMLVSISACKKDDKDNQKGQANSDSNILISVMLPNPDGMSGGHYMQLIPSMEEASYDNNKAFPIPFSAPPFVIGDDIFILPGWSNETNTMDKYSKESGILTKKASLTLPENSAGTNIVTKGNKAYITLAQSGKIMIIDHTNMKKLGEIDLSQYAVQDKNPDPASMVIRGKYLFVGLTQMVGGYFPPADRPKSDILIIDTETDKVEKMITEETFGISTPTRPIDPKSIFVDENDDIYIACIGAWGVYPNHKSGILRIKSGELEFDKSYAIVLGDLKIVGENNKVDYLQYVQYAGNGKLYATANCMAYQSNPPNYIEDRTVVPIEIDLNAKTAKRINIDRGNSFGQAIALYNDKVIFGLGTETQNGYFTYDPITGDVSTSPIIKVTGYPYSMRIFGSKY